MRLYADAIVTNQFNQALFVRRNDSRTWAPPGGSLEAGELPTEAVKREVEEETGLKIMPVRLVGLYFRPEKPQGLLVFVFRCIQRGGQLQTSKESPQVGFMDVNPLPRPMLGIHREMYGRALKHQGGSPYWGYQPMPLGVRLLRDLLYGAYDFWRAVRRRPSFQPPPEWQVGAFTIVKGEEDRVLWVRRRDRNVWNLPGGGSQPIEAPWETAARATREETGLEVDLADVTGVYTIPEAGEAIFTFRGTCTGGKLTPNEEAAEFAYFAPGSEPANSLPKQVERVADACGPQKTTIIREQPEPLSPQVQARANDHSRGTSI